MKIYHEQTFVQVDDAGQETKVIRRYPQRPKSDDADGLQQGDPLAALLPAFHANVTFQFSIQGTDLVVPHSMRVPIAGLTAEEAFANMPEALDQAKAIGEKEVTARLHVEMQAQAAARLKQQTQIVTPAQHMAAQAGLNGHGGRMKFPRPA